MQEALGRIGFALILLGCAAAANAHHSFPVYYVPDKIIKVTGVVTGFRFRNPHGLIFFTVRGKDGTRAQWKAETNSPNILRRRGWSEDAFKPGQRITVEGYPSRDGSNRLRVYRVLLPDGRIFVSQRPGAGVGGADSAKK